MSTHPSHHPRPLHDALHIPTPASEGRALVATVGGGGKTTLLFALAAERLDAERSNTRHRISVLTTTTRFTIPPQGDSLPLILSAAPLARITAIADIAKNATATTTLIVGSQRCERQRVRGVEPDWPAQALNVEGVDFVAVEADGAAGRPFKAPASHEPVIPHGVTHVVAVVGVHALGKPLDARTVHRPQHVRAIVDETNNTVAATITAGIVARVLAHPNGGRKSVPAGAHFAVVITHAMRNRDGAAAIGAACRALGVDRVITYDARAGLVQTL